MRTDHPVPQKRATEHALSAARGRAPGIIPVESTRRPSADIIPTSLGDLFGYRWAFRCCTEASSDTILEHAWASLIGSWRTLARR